MKLDPLLTGSTNVRTLGAKLAAYRPQRRQWSKGFAVHALRLRNGLYEQSFQSIKAFLRAKQPKRSALTSVLIKNLR
ncbi:MAG: hypothetical protein K0R08_344 [Solimicrobium sp.]|nr:hypothetical protein [Solimicrobium sp.]